MNLFFSDKIPNFAIVEVCLINKCIEVTMTETNHVVLWNRCLEIIKDNVPERTFSTWFAPIVPLKYEDKTLIVQIPSQFFYEILEEK